MQSISSDPLPTNIEFIENYNDIIDFNNQLSGSGYNLKESLQLF